MTTRHAAGSEPARARPRAVRLAVRLGVAMLAGGAQTREVESDLRTVLDALGLPDAEAVVTYSSVTVSSIDPATADTATATGVVRRWRPDYSRLAAAAGLVRAVAEGRADLPTAEAELARVVDSPHAYPRWLRFTAPAVLSTAVTVMFGGAPVDAAATLGIGLAIQPLVERIEDSDLTAFFQVVAGVLATALLVLVLVQAGAPVDAGLVLTGGLLRFLPGATLVAGMHDLVDGAVTSGAARLAEVALLGAAVAGGIALVDALAGGLGTPLEITTEGAVHWPAALVVAAGTTAVAFHAFRVGVPRNALLWVMALGGVAVVLSRGFLPGTEGLRGVVGVLLAAVVIGVVGRWQATRRRTPAALWCVPAILPLLPAPTTLVPAFATDGAGREALQDLAVATAFAIGVGVATGSVLVDSWLRYRALVRGARGPAARARAALRRVPRRAPRRDTQVSAPRGGS